MRNVFFLLSIRYRIDIKWWCNKAIDRETKVNGERSEWTQTLMIHSW